MSGNNTFDEGTYYNTSDNRYSSNVPISYTTRKAAQLFSVSPRRIRQISQTFNIGCLDEKRWTFSVADLTLLDKHIKKGKRRSRMEDEVGTFLHGEKSMRDVTPKTVDQLIEYVAQQFPSIRRQFFDLLRASMDAAHAEHVKGFNELRKHEYDNYADIRIIFSLLAERGILPKPLGKHTDDKEGNEGRGRLLFGDAAPLTLTTHEATEAAA
jgi:hypothetical protein